MAFEFNPFTGSLDSVGLSQASADARYVLKVAGSFSGLTGAGFRDTSAAFDVTLGFTSSAALTAARALTLDVVNASRSIKLAGNVDLGGNFTTTGSGTLALGGFTLTVPATGTAALLGTANVFTTLQTITQGTVNTGVLASTGYSLTGSNATSMIDLAGTWNTSGNPAALKLNIINTASGATARVFDLQVGSASKVSANVNGCVFLNGGTSAEIGRRSDVDMLMLHAVSDDVSVGVIGIGGSGYQYGINIRATATMGWTPDTPASGRDLILGRKAPAVLRMGEDAAGVTNQMLTAASRITSDGVGANLTIAGGNGRGGAGGSLILATYDTQGAGTIGVLRTRLIIDTAGLSTFNSSVTVGAGNLTLSDAVNVVLGETTGTKIGTAATQKLGFWNMTPIVQPDTSVTPATFASNSGTNVYDASTWDGYSIGHIVAALRNIGILA